MTAQWSDDRPYANVRRIPDVPVPDLYLLPPVRTRRQRRLDERANWMAPKPRWLEWAGDFERFNALPARVQSKVRADARRMYAEQPYLTVKRAWREALRLEAARAKGFA